MPCTPSGHGKVRNISSSFAQTANQTTIIKCNYNPSTSKSLKPESCRQTTGLILFHAPAYSSVKEGHKAAPVWCWTVSPSSEHSPHYKRTKPEKGQSRTENLIRPGPRQCLNLERRCLRAMLLPLSGMCPQGACVVLETLLETLA